MKPPPSTVPLPRGDVSPDPPGRRAGRVALLKGAGELQNLGDMMMRKVAQDIIQALGFDVIHTTGHWDDPAALAREVGPVEALFVLGSIQFSDAWRSPSLAQRLDRAIRFHGHFPGARVTFLPSTWGAFEPEHAAALAKLTARSRLLVRDEFSVDSINHTLGSPAAEYCPDLAFLHPTASPALARPLLERLVPDPARPLLGIIPNQRCTQPGVTPLADTRAYVDYLTHARDFATARGFNVVAITHMRNTDRDLELIREIGIPCFPAGDLEMTRSAIANLSAAICSRYHGVVSCLSHGTPVIALGWHHKYRSLMNDMKVGAYHLSVAQLPADPAPLLGDLLQNHPCLRRAIRRTVDAARELVRLRIERLHGDPEGAPPC